LDGDWSNLCISSNSVGSVCVSKERPRSTRQTFRAASNASKSFEPRVTVLCAIPVAHATALTPPYPAARVSAATNKRRDGFHSGVQPPSSGGNRFGGF
jgi:hypothetical protein